MSLFTRTIAMHVAGLSFCALTLAANPIVGMVVLPVRPAQIVFVTKLLRLAAVFCFHVRGREATVTLDSLVGPPLRLFDSLHPVGITVAVFVNVPHDSASV